MLYPLPFLLEFRDEQFNRRRGIEISKEYDPEYLRDLRQPKPRDQPSDLPESFFTFDDAFEDLMCAHFSGEILDIHEMASDRLYLRYKHPQGEPVAEQMDRFASHGNFVIRRHNSQLAGHRALVEVPEALAEPLRSGNASTILDALQKQAAGNGMKHTALESNKPFPQDELELADHAAEKASKYSWPSPLDSLRSIFSSSSSDDDGVRSRFTFTSSSESRRVHVDENGTTEEKITEHTDDDGHRIKIVLERRFDAEGKVLSETKKQFVDGKEQEKDVYAGLD